MENLQENFSPLGAMQPSATLAISAKAKELKASGADICSMTAGEPDFDTPLAIKEACIQALNEGKVRYLAASGLPELKNEIVKISFFCTRKPPDSLVDFYYFKYLFFMY